MAVNWALVGYGGMGGWHVDKLRTMEEIHICGVYDINPERNAAAEKNGLHPYSSLEELLQDPQVELITIATPNDSHRSIAEKALAAGKHVISEKPVTVSSKDLEAMIDASKTHNRIFTVHQNRRWDEDYLVVKKLVEENAVGKVFCVESRVQGSRGVPGDWRNTKEQGGGMVLDWGVHLLDQILQMYAQPIVKVFCTLSHVTNDAVDDGFRATLTFKDGVEAQVEVGTSNFISLPRWVVLGENGTAIIENWQLDGKVVKVSNWEKRDAVPVVTAAGLTKTMAPRTEETIQTYPLPKVHSDVRDFYRNMCRAVHGEATQLVTHDQMMRAMHLMEAMFLSDEKGEVVHTSI